MQFKLLLIALAITITVAQDKEWDVCDFTSTDSKDGVMGYPLNKQTGVRDQTANLECVKYEAQACSQRLGELGSEPSQSGISSTSDIISYCNIEGGELKVNVVQHNWNDSGVACEWEYIYREGKMPQAIYPITQSEENFQKWVDQDDTKAIDVTRRDGIDFTVGEAPNEITGNGSTWTIAYELSKIISDTTVFTNVTPNDNNTDFVFKAQFAWSIFSNANEQLAYAFDVTLTIDRETSAQKDLQVTKTLVAGQCCKNSLGVESQLRFCPKDDKFCDSDKEIQEIARNTEFYVQHELKLTHADTAALSPSYNLYPDSITIGPFFPIWSLENGWGDNSKGINGVAILIQSNVAFVASVTVASRLWDKNIALPHTCFYTGNGYQSEGVACTSGSASRRFLQASESGKAETQMSSSKGIVVTDDGSNNQNGNGNNGKKSDDDDDNNTVLIAVVVALVVVLLMGGVIGGVYFCKNRNQKQQQQQNQYNQDVKNVQQQQQA